MSHEKQEIWVRLDHPRTNAYSLTHDITEPVQVLYDLAHSSMDWGSGFLDTDEMRSVVRLAILMGWEVPDLSCAWNHGPALTVAQEFPDHYEITVTTNKYKAAHHTGYEVKTKKGDQ